MNKKCVVVYDENKEPIDLYEVKELTLDQFLEVQKKVQENKQKLLSKEQEINVLKDRIYRIELELKFNRGEISREEFESL